MIGWPLSCAWAVACLLGDESQHPTLPQLRHILRCSQRLSVLRHSSQPLTRSGSSVTWIWSKWAQACSVITAPRPSTLFGSRLDQVTAFQRSDDLLRVAAP